MSVLEQRKKKIRRKKFIITILVILALAAGARGYYYYMQVQEAAAADTEITAGENQELVYALVNSMNGNELSYTVVTMNDTESDAAAGGFPVGDTAADGSTA